ncbi:MAG: ribbon-helix-helix domain-containing protein [Promethearchaeia archaeon]
MSSKTTIAVDKSLRKLIKKLAAWLDISQGEVIKRAIAEYEKKILTQNKRLDKNDDDIKIKIQEILKASTESVWMKDQETKEIQQKLLKDIESLDDYLLNNWDTGLEL